MLPTVFSPLIRCLLFCVPLLLPAHNKVKRQRVWQCCDGVQSSLCFGSDSGDVALVVSGSVEGKVRSSSDCRGVAVVFHLLLMSKGYSSFLLGEGSADMQSSQQDIQPPAKKQKKPRREKASKACIICQHDHTSCDDCMFPHLTLHSLNLFQHDHARGALTKE